MIKSETSKIVQNIKKRRLELGFSYQDLADRTNLSRSTLQRYETGAIKNLPLSKLEILAAALCTTPEYIMGWTDEPTTSVLEDTVSTDVNTSSYTHKNSPTFTDENFAKNIKIKANLSNKDLCGTMSIPTIVSIQGNRITYQMNLMFRQISNIFDYSVARSKDNNDGFEAIDIKDLHSGYLNPDKVNALVNYVVENFDSYILPPISAVTPKALPFYPYNHEEIIHHLGEEYDLMKRPELTTVVLEEFNGMLQGFIYFNEADFNVDVLDGIHRVAGIHKLNTMGKEFKNLRIGTEIFVESDLHKQRQAFLDIISNRI